MLTNDPVLHLRRGPSFKPQRSIYAAALFLIVWAGLSCVNNQMTEHVLISGNLATPLRTIAGVLGQFGFIEATDSQIASMVADAGLPLSALQQLDFPIALRQELQICSRLVELIDPQSSPITLVAGLQDSLRLEVFGVIGMTMIIMSVLGVLFMVVVFVFNLSPIVVVLM